MGRHGGPAGADLGPHVEGHGDPGPTTAAVRGHMVHEPRGEHHDVTGLEPWERHARPTAGGGALLARRKATVGGVDAGSRVGDAERGADIAARVNVQHTSGRRARALATPDSAAQCTDEQHMPSPVGNWTAPRLTTSTLTALITIVRRLNAFNPIAQAPHQDARFASRRCAIAPGAVGGRARHAGIPSLAVLLPRCRRHARSPSAPSHGPTDGAVKR